VYQLQWRRATSLSNVVAFAGTATSVRPAVKRSAADMWVFLSELATLQRATKTLLTPGCYYQFRARAARLKPPLIAETALISGACPTESSTNSQADPFSYGSWSGPSDPVRTLPAPPPKPLRCRLTVRVEASQRAKLQTVSLSWVLPTLNHGSPISGVRV